jgi:UDP-N-acetyl-D-mannosaminuronate dehydrogenase
MRDMPCASRFERDAVVIGGCGHVGLPLAIAFADRDARVGIFDVSETAVALVNSAQMPTASPGRLPCSRASSRTAASRPQPTRPSWPSRST